MPPEVQEQMVHSLPGLENAKILKYGYAIEYDAIYPTQLHASLETKILENLYTAGQINGTSGYEEAACQGLMAGINASLKLEGKEPLVLKRSDAYIGVLIDDVITKGIRDPYRLLTSRAEFRLLLRSDSADLRLREYGYNVGMISEEQMNRLNDKKEQIAALNKYMEDTKLKITEEVKNKFIEANIQLPVGSLSLEKLIKRPEINMTFLSSVIDNRLNDVMKRLTSLTVLMAIPTIISGIWGMNTNGDYMPFAKMPFGFYLICIFIVIICAIVVWFMKKKKML
jgi:tRNA uridine 5-carboxymethylaminomethyl modification enzyme